MSDEQPREDEAREDERVRHELRRLSRRGFLGLAAGAGAVVFGWRWLLSRPMVDRLPAPFRSSLEANAALWGALASNDRRVPEYPRSAAAKRPRVNGRLGLDRKADPAAWKLRVEGAHGGELQLPLAALQALPTRELTTELRCVEGWSMIVTWTGARLSDFMAAYPPAARDGSRADVRRDAGSLPRFVSLETPGRGYYVGLDLASALHPQTLLAWGINGAPLPWEHGAPLRLAIPIKYGVKSLKRIGTLRYTDVRPADYWAERGYDWDLGH
jgi:DMSO/TMAO reductase YedYZ molybdopterin-dependent catalytic subunit